MAQKANMSDLAGSGQSNCKKQLEQSQNEPKEEQIPRETLAWLHEHGVKVVENGKKQ